MRQPHALPFATVAALLVALASPVAAQKKAVAPAPAARAAQAAAQAPAKAAPPAAAAAAAPIDLNAVATRAGLDGAARARVAPHIAAMNAERARMHALTGKVGPNTPKADKDRIHAELNTRFKSFAAHWSEATAGMSQKQKDAFDAAVREQMGSRPRAVGNPHSKLPPAHPKLAPNGGPLKK